MEKYGVHRKLAFVYRHPNDRFISAFYSRLQQGRPTYQILWSPAEAVAYSFFETPTQLAESLSSENERLKSAAIFAFNSILHLKLNYRHYLESREFMDFEYRRGAIIACCNMKYLNRHEKKFFAALGGSTENFLNQKLQKPIRQDTTLSESAISNLRIFWKEEYDIFDKCEEISAQMGYR